MILGAVGTGKTSACMYPYVDQLLRWRGGRSRPQDGRPGAGGEGRLLPAGARCILTRRASRRLRRDRARHGRLLQPAAQRSRSVRRGLRHRHAAEQPVRQVEGAVLAAGVHRPAEVRDPAPADHRRLHDASPRSTATSSTTADRQDIRALQAQFKNRRTCSSCRRSSTRCTAAGAVDALVAVRGWPTHGAPVRCRARDLPGGTRAVPFDVRTGDGPSRPGRAPAPARGRRALVLHGWSGSTEGSARRSSRASSCSCRCSTTTRPSPRVLSAARPTRAAGRESRAAAAARGPARDGHVLALNFPVA
jgi:hypothetical protein